MALNHKITKQKLSLKKIPDGTGLILNVNHLCDVTKKLCFTRACFNRTGNYLAAATKTGDVIILNFTVQKYWLFTHLASCTALTFLPHSDTEVVAGARDGDLKVFDVDNAAEKATLSAHNCSVRQISFTSRGHQCLTASKVEAVIWDVKSWTVVRVLTLERNCEMKYIAFVPVSGDIFACFHDDVIHVWKCGSYTDFKQIMPAKWNKVSVKAIAVTRNGRCVLIGGRSPFVTAFLLDTWNLYQIFYLPNYIKSVRQMDFIPRLFDDGTSNLLCILAGNGIIYVYDMTENVVLLQIGARSEIVSFIPANGGKYMACVLCTGEVSVYDVTDLLYCEDKRKSVVTVTPKRKARAAKSFPSKDLIPRDEVQAVFDLEKLQTILKQYGQYPDAYRAKIWEHVLQLPCNNQFYNMLIRHPVHNRFNDLEKRYPLINKIALQNLKRTLNNLVTWCPFFGHVKYLALFIFPFVKVFHAVPVLCFEAAITIIMNWCQHWFEYYPLPPMNILGMVENLLLEHDPRLLDHLMKHDVTSTVYAWSLLRVSFSETLTAQEWYVFWDHVLVNEPAFFLMAVVAYSIVNRMVLLSLSDPSDFYRFYHGQNVPDMKVFVTKTYQLLEGTSERNHPRKYLKAFAGLGSGKYPTFSDYPKTLIGYKESELRGFDDEEAALEHMKKTIAQRKSDIKESLHGIEVQEEESKRLKSLESIYHQKIAEEQERVLEEKKKLMEMQKQLHEEELAKLVTSRDKLVERSVREKCATLERLIKNVQSGKFAEELEMEKAHSSFMEQRKDLIEVKSQIEQFLRSKGVSKYTAHSSVREQQKALTKEIRKMTESVISQPVLKRLNIATGLAAIEDLMETVEIELAKEVSEKQERQRRKEAEKRINDLQKQTKTMEADIFALNTLLEQAKIAERQKQVTEVFRAKGSMISSINESQSKQEVANCTKTMMDPSDGCKAPPASATQL